MACFIPPGRADKRQTAHNRKVLDLSLQQALRLDVPSITPLFTSNVPEKGCEKKKTHPTDYRDRDRKGLDGKTGLLTGLLAGKQGWKCPVSLLATCCGSKLLKVILIDSDFGYYPLLNPPVTL